MQEPRSWWRKSILITFLKISFIKLLNNFLASASENDLHAEFESCLKKLQQIPVLYTVADKNIVRSMINQRVIIREYFHARNTLNYKKALEHINELEKYLSENNGLVSGTHQVMFFYHIAYTHFIHTNIKKAIFWANKIINTTTSPDKLFFHSFARILILMCYFEQGDVDALKYQLRSAERFLIKHDKLYSLENILIRFFKNYLNKPDKTNAQELLPAFEKDLQKNFNPMEYKIMEYFDVFAWYKSKVRGQTLLQVMEEKEK